MQHSSNIQQTLDSAIQHHMAGQLPQAKGLYEEVLAKAPNQPDALRMLGILARQVGKLDISIELIGKAIAARPDYADAHYDLGVTFQGLNRYDDAVTCYQKAISIHPNYVAAYNNLGFVYQQQGRFDDAISHYKEAISFDPSIAELHLNLGLVLREQGKLDDAINCYRKAISINPNIAEAHNSLGVALESEGNLDEAVSCFQKALSIDPQHGIAHYGLGNLYRKLKRNQDAENSYLSALKILPNFENAQIAYKSLITGQVAPWHFPMMNDVPRNIAYENAIKSTINSDSIVLDIGTGSGLLAMMAARSGARSVDAAEMVPAIAHAATNIIKRNGFDHIIKVHNAVSTSLKVGTDIPKKANVLVTETFDVGLLGENAVESIKHARANLLTDDAVIIPQSAQVFCALFESMEIYKRGRVGIVSGFDLSPFNDLARPYDQLCLNDYAYEFISEELAIFDIDFMGKAITPDKKEMAVRPLKSAVCHGVALWFRLHLDGTQIFDTAADQNADNHWEQAIFYLDAPITVSSSQDVQLTVSHNTKIISVSLSV
ncbi:tetratricopeptide repeat protein [Magnetovibrio blakemorei]|uniref:Protein arginine N-methyltransferase domain-containing protein n=1 Tax=Magnetovibrio blakemorei TaxID=28181 RepID=A0A1E5Q758_9PROT|nr:tetratricopeptide repeat protein [Magnetovibrio blakemorei]OEJ66255.1 hypothetical protein BEN30_12765 [Magnetovibrio blakemorei]